MTRIGTGYDVHRLVDGRRLVIGGVDIPYEKGLLGHSDADVRSVICDSLLGAGSAISASTSRARSAVRGSRALKLLGEVSVSWGEGFPVNNIDAVVMSVRNGPIPQMTANVAAAVKVVPGR
jgi:2-C-methyl-D-erythritol 2,4-cyclodiphosphate synthase